MEAKDCIEDANDSFETTYFDEDMEDAREAVRFAARCALRRVAVCCLLLPNL